jgi:hypothetical protein
MSDPQDNRHHHRHTPIATATQLQLSFSKPSSCTSSPLEHLKHSTLKL